MILTGLACQLLLGRWGVRSRPVFLFNHGDLRRSLAGPSYPAAPLSLAPKIPLLFTLIPDKPGFQPPLNHVRKTLLQALKDAIREESYARELPLLTSFLQSRPLPPPSVADCSLPAKLLASERRWVTLSLYYQLCLSYPSPDPTPHAETLSRWDLSSLPGRDAVLQELLAASLTSTSSDPVPLELLQLLDFSLTGNLQQVDDASIQSQSQSPSTATATTTTAISSSLQNILRLAAIIAHYGDPARASALWCLVLARGHKQPLLQSLQHPALLEIFCSHILPDAVDQGVNKTLSPLLQALVDQWSDQPAVLAKLTVGIVSALAEHAAVRDCFLEVLRSHLGSLSPQEEAAHAFLRHLSEFQPDGPLRTELLLLLLGPTSRQKQGMLLSASLPTDSLLFLFHLSLGEVSISSLPTSEMVCNLSANILRSPDHFPAFISTMMALGRHWSHSNSSLPVLSLLCAKVFDSPSHQPSDRSLESRQLLANLILTELMDHPHRVDLELSFADRIIGPMNMILSRPNCAALIRRSRNRDDVDFAERIFRHARERHKMTPDLVAFYLDALSRHLSPIDPALALGFVQEVSDYCFSIDIFRDDNSGRLVAVLIDAFNFAKSIDGVHTLWSKLTARTPPYSFEPNHYVSRLEALLAAGQFPNAFAEFKTLRKSKPALITQKMYVRLLRHSIAHDLIGYYYLLRSYYNVDGFDSRNLPGDVIISKKNKKS